MVKLDPDNGRGFSLDQYPFELVAAILGQAARVDHDNTAGEPRFIASPLILRQVCHSWKAFADSTPALWQALIISFPRMEADIVTGVKEWTDRAGNIPIDIYIDGSNLRQTFAWFKKFAGIAELLANLSPRWKLLQLRNLRSFFVRQIQSRTVSRARRSLGEGAAVCPILETVAVHFGSNEFPYPNVLDLRSLNQLRSLDLRGLQNNFDHHAIPQSNAAQLISLRLERTAFDFQVLGSFLNLKSLHFSPSDDPPANPFVSMSKVFLNHLESLTFNATTWNTTSSFLSLLSLPKLTDLSIALNPCLKADPVAQPIPEAQPQFEEDLLLILSSYRELTQLRLVIRIDGLKIGHTFFEELGFHKETPQLPKLRIFSYEGNLQLESMSQLEPLLARCTRTRHSHVHITTHPSRSEPTRISHSSNVASLKFVKIRSNDLRTLLLPENLSRDTEIEAIVKEMVAQDVLWLIDDDEKSLM